MGINEIKNLLKKYHYWPVKRLGQNFLINKLTIKKVIKTAELGPADIILEIGPGPGILTLELAKKVKEVLAVEKDKTMIEILKEVIKKHQINNVKVIHQDILKFNPQKYKLKNRSYKIVANLPFYLTAPVIRKFLEKTPILPSQMVLVVQKEVGQRICAQHPRLNLLAISVQFYAQPQIISFISKKSFWPSPRVDSTIIKIKPNSSVFKIKPLVRQQFFKLVRAGFSQPRKQLLNNLAKILNLKNKEKIKSWLLKYQIQPNQRAETLKIEDWLNLSKNLWQLK
ncbi:MAG: 16S rRNA (adenine(1518)-N(6)/adenine(1519)-N(6))-dimethyltransferase RsmA [Minisyncoccales bacterium]